MKICRPQFKSLALLSVCLCLGLLLFVPQTKAEIVITPITKTNITITTQNGCEGVSQSLTIPSYSGNALMVCESYFYAGSGNLWFNSATTTDINTSNDLNGGYLKFSYVENPPIGQMDNVQNCSYPYGYGESMSVSCYLVEGANIATISQISNTSGGYCDLSRSIGSLTSGDLAVVDFYSNEFSYPNDFVSTTNDIWNTRNTRIFGRNAFGVSLYSVATTTTQFFSASGVANCATPTSFGFSIKQATPPASTGYCGDNICNGTETDLTCIDCLTFYDLSENVNAYFKFDNYSNYCPINTTCKINWTFDTSIFNNQDVGHFYWYENSTSTPIDLGYKMLNTSIDLGVYNKGYYATSSAATSTSYSFLAVVPYSSKINTAIATSTTGIWFTEPKNWEQIKTDYYASTSEWANIANMSIDFHTMACTNEEWTEAATSTSWFNFTKLKCNSFYSLLLIGNTVSKIPATVANSFSYLFKTAFPFNIGVKIKQSWDNSASSTLPAGMSFITNRIDANGNIYLTSPNIPGIATTTNVIFGPAMGGTGNTEWPTFYEFIRFATTYIFWGLFIYYGIIIRGIRIYQKIKEEI